MNANYSTTILGQRSPVCRINSDDSLGTLVESRGWMMDEILKFNGNLSGVSLSDAYKIRLT
jgi:hypothetical protein